MAKANDFGVGLMHETAITASKAGWEPEDFSLISKDENLMRLVRGVLHGTHEIKSVDNMIDCDNDPFIPYGWQVKEHRKMGNIEFDLSKLRFFISEKQKVSNCVEGSDLNDELKSKKILNANVLDYLLSHPYMIPEKWKRDKYGETLYIVFWGTIYYRLDIGHFCVRCLYYYSTEKKWYWGSTGLTKGFSSFGYNSQALLVK